MLSVRGAAVARQPHTYLGIDLQGCLSRITTQGNAGAHIALRGSDLASNSDQAFIAEALDKLKEAGLPPQLIVTCHTATAGGSPPDRCPSSISW